jgi:hypothetical protein
MATPCPGQTIPFLSFESCYRSRRAWLAGWLGRSHGDQRRVPGMTVRKSFASAWPWMASACVLHGSACIDRSRVRFGTKTNPQEAFVSGKGKEEASCGQGARTWKESQGPLNPQMQLPRSWGSVQSGKGGFCSQGSLAAPSFRQPHNPARPPRTFLDAHASLVVIVICAECALASTWQSEER